MTTFVPGDLVRLKSGGPTMTVDEAARACTCAWFRHNRMYEGSFVEVALEVAPAPASDAADTP